VELAEPQKIGMDAPSRKPWSDFHRRWLRLKPPLRPNEEVRAAIRAALAGSLEHALLLGVTPELSDIALNTTAVDRSAMMIALAWPGNTPMRKAVNGNWLNLPCRDRLFSAVLGDGSLNCLDYPQGYRRLYEQLGRVLLPEAKLAIRCYVTPDSCETLAVVREQTMAGRRRGFHALKWRLAMAIAAERSDPNVPVWLIRDVFNREFPDRARLVQATNWSEEEISEIDDYRDAVEIFSFPTRQQLLAVVPDAFAKPRFAASGTYELADHCPLLVMELKS